MTNEPEPIAPHPLPDQYPHQGPDPDCFHDFPRGDKGKTPPRAVCKRCGMPADRKDDAAVLGWIRGGVPS